MYCTPEEIRAEGITEEQATDERLYELCEYAADFVDKVTGQWFEPRELTLTFSGKDTSNLRLPVFLIDKLKVSATTAFSIWMTKPLLSALGSV